MALNFTKRWIVELNKTAVHQSLKAITVIALINGSAVVKKFLLQMGRIILHSTNPTYPDIEINETDQFKIAGVVLRIVEKTL